MKLHAYIAILVVLFLASCNTPVQVESQQLVPQIVEQETSTSIINVQEPTEDAEEHALPEERLPFDFQSVSGAKIPEKVNFVTQDGVKIYGSYFKPSKAPAPTVIMLHMLGKSRGDYSKLAKAFQKEGFAILTLDSRGHGASVFHQGQRKKYTSYTEEDWQQLPEDVAAAKDYLLKRGEVSSLAIIGASIGANTALVYAAQDDDVDTIILLSPGMNYRGLETTDAIHAYGERSVLFVAAEGDKFSYSSSEQLDSIAKGPHKFVQYAGNKHGTDMLLAHGTLDDEIYTWLTFFMTG